MRHAILKPAFALLLFAACASPSAQSLDRLAAEYQKVRAEGEVSHIFDLDNDTLLLNRDDGFYTSGVRYSREYALAGADGVKKFGWRIGQEIYTASDINWPPEWVGPPNRPYAGWLYAGFFKEDLRPDGRYARVGFDIGCLGPCSGAEWAQTTLHRVLNQPEPQAWSKQVRTEVGVVLYGEMAPLRWNLGPSVDVTPRVQGRFGNIYTDVGAGFLARAGKLNTMPDGPTLHGFINMHIRAVGYNGTLQGGYFSSGNPHTVDPKRVVGAAEAGVAWKRGPHGIKLSVVRHSNEIEDLSESVGGQTFVRLQWMYTPDQ